VSYFVIISYACFQIHSFLEGSRYLYFVEHLEAHLSSRSVVVQLHFI